jgi:hypothetical protein
MYKGIGMRLLAAGLCLGWIAADRGDQREYVREINKGADPRSQHIMRDGQEVQATTAPGR